MDGVNAHCLSSEGVTIVASYSNCPLFYEACEQPRPAILGSRALSRPDIPTKTDGPHCTRPMRRCEHPFYRLRALRRAAESNRSSGARNPLGLAQGDL